MKSRKEPEILRLLAEGLNGAQIGQKLGCTRACVSQVRKRHGMARTPALRVDKATRQATQAAPLNVALGGENLLEPKRADRLLRRFSFQDLPTDDFVRSRVSA